VATVNFDWYHKAFANEHGGEVAGDTFAVDYLSDTIKIALLTNAYTPGLDTHEVYSDLTSEVASGGGYTTGGNALASKTLTVTAANSWGISRANTTAYAVGDVVRPASANGFLYRCVVAGTSAGSPPTFSTVIGGGIVAGTEVGAVTVAVIVDAGAPAVSDATSTTGAVTGGATVSAGSPAPGATVGVTDGAASSLDVPPVGPGRPAVALAVGRAGLVGTVAAQGAEEDSRWIGPPPGGARPRTFEVPLSPLVRLGLVGPWEPEADAAPPISSVSVTARVSALRPVTAAAPWLLPERAWSEVPWAAPAAVRAATPAVRPVGAFSATMTWAPQVAVVSAGVVSVVAEPQVISVTMTSVVSDWSPALSAEAAVTPVIAASAPRYEPAAGDALVPVVGLVSVTSVATLVPSAGVRPVLALVSARAVAAWLAPRTSRSAAARTKAVIARVAVDTWSPDIGPDQLEEILALLAALDEL
jgi:hypothetical protein